jgi:phage protein D
MGDLGSSSAFYASRPSLKIDGREVANLEEGLLSLSVEETTAGLFSCEACFGNWGSGEGEVGFLYFDLEVFDFGRELEVTLGDGDSRATAFSGRITALEGRYPRQAAPELMVLAEDRCQDLRMVRRTRTFENMRDRDVFESIAREHGLTPEIDLDGPTYCTLAQLNQSDLAFLRERARAVDAEVWVEGTSLFAQARRRRRAEAVTLTYGQGLRELVVSADLAHQRTRLAVGGWDVAGKEAIEEEVGEEAVSGELAGGTSGSRTLEDAFGERAERIVHTVPLSRDEARAVAESHYRSAARRFLCGEGVAEGDARIRVAARLTLAGVGPLYDGAYYVTAARHTFDPKNGYQTWFCLERPGLGGGS